MNRMDAVFQGLKNQKEKALVGFVTAGDPTVEQSVNLIISLCQAGLDILELGVPFSDPTADGPVIQRSSARALKNGVSLKTVLNMTRTIRNRVPAIPIILFSYYNPIHAYGKEAFYTDAVAAGADGALIVDLPPEESEELTSGWNRSEFCLIRLVAPTTPVERMRFITASASGFVYLVSKTGVTGSDGLDTSEIATHTRLLRSVTTLPICVGFGISTPEDVATVAATADGVVIGSAFERMIEENLDNPMLISVMTKKTGEFKKACLMS